MSSDVEKHLHTRLTNSGVVNALVSSRVYPIQAPSSANLPYIVYGRQATEFVNNGSGFSGSAIATISVTSWAETYNGAKTLADATRSALNGWRDQGQAPKIDLASLTNESDVILSPEEGSEFPEAYGVQHEIMVSFEE